MRWDWIVEILRRYGEALREGWWALGLLGIAGIAVGLLWTRGRSEAQSPAARVDRLLRGLVFATVAAGVVHAARRASLIDDAFISFHYARNWSRHLGWVFNPGEFVEGYTNFLWVFVLGVIDRVAGLEPPGVALVLNLASLTVVLLAGDGIGRRMARAAGGTPRFSLAALWLAASPVFVAWGTTGMETMPATACVVLGLRALLDDASPRRSLAAASALILAVFLRPDHAIFYAVGGLTILSDAWRKTPGGEGSETWQSTAFHAAAYAMPAVAYGVYMVWRWRYYGDWLPNTYYAKSADRFYVEQGVVYALVGWLGTGLGFVTIAAVALALKRARTGALRRMRLFTLASLATYHLYLLKTGGDFMFARFQIPLLALAAVWLESEAWNATGFSHDAGTAPTALGRPLRRAGIAAALVFALSLPFFRLIPPGEVRWWISDEAASSPLAPGLPWRPDIDYARSAAAIRTLLTDRGVQPVVASGAVGLLGYDSGLTRIVDLYGLIDRAIARRPLPERRRPGHEKWPSTEDLWARGVHISLVNWNPCPLGDVNAIDIGEFRWHLLRYDRALMATIAQRSPEVRFLDFESFLDTYIARMPTMTREKVARDMAWFTSYYFAWNDDPARRDMIAARLSEAAP